MRQSRGIKDFLISTVDQNILNFMFEYGPFENSQLKMISNVQQISFLGKFNSSVEDAAIKALRSNDMVAFCWLYQL